MAEAHDPQVLKLHRAFSRMYYWEKMEFLKEVGAKLQILFLKNENEAVINELKG